MSPVPRLYRLCPKCRACPPLDVKPLSNSAPLLGWTDHVHHQAGRDAQRRRCVTYPSLGAALRRDPPERTPGGYRLYSDDEIARLRAMRELIERGWSAAQAATAARGTAIDGGGREIPSPPSSPTPPDLVAAAARYDLAAVEDALDGLFGRGSFEAVIDDLVLTAVARSGRRGRTERSTWRPSTWPAVPCCDGCRRCSTWPASPAAVAGCLSVCHQGADTSSVRWPSRWRCDGWGPTSFTLARTCRPRRGSPPRPRARRRRRSSAS